MNSRIKACLLLVVLLESGTAFAITDEEIFRNFQFSFVNPGARATAMGNAFIALADDATAAEANPAGLTILNKPEISIEFRNIEYDSGTLNANNSLNSDNPFARILVISSSNELHTTRRPSFFSFVYPKRQTVFAFSRQESVHLNGSIDEVFDHGANLLQSADGRVNQAVINWNFSVAHKFGEHISIGISLRLSHLSWQTSVDNFQIYTDIPFCSDPCKVSIFETSINANANAFAWNAGVIYRINKNLRVGGVYKRNARFSVNEVESGESSGRPGLFETGFKVPDIVGVGIAILPSESIVITADIVRIEYSDLLEGFDAGRNILTSLYDSSDVQYSVDNATEFRAGAEFFVVWKQLPVAIRQGIYRKPSNSLVLSSAEGLRPLDKQILERVFSRTEDEIHVTIGNGFVFSNFQVDWAFDYSKPSSQFVISTVARF